MTGATVAKLDDSPVYARGDGVETTLLIGRERCPAAALTSGLTRFPPGKKVPFHYHNCDEQVTVIEGEALVEIEGQESVAVGRRDTTYIPAGKSHVDELAKVAELAKDTVIEDKVADMLTEARENWLRASMDAVKPRLTMAVLPGCSDFVDLGTLLE